MHVFTYDRNNNRESWGAKRYKSHLRNDSKVVPNNLNPSAWHRKEILYFKQIRSEEQV